MKILYLTIERRRSRNWKVLVCVTNKDNQNLTPSQKELLQGTLRLVHIGFQHVQWLIRTGHLKVQGNSKTVANCEMPNCAACEFGMGLSLTQ